MNINFNTLKHRIEEYKQEFNEVRDKYDCWIDCGEVVSIVVLIWLICLLS